MDIIYYVEADKSIGSIIEKTMLDENLQGIGFHTGKDFLIKYYQKKPDMILLNIELSGMSGLDLLKEIRSQDSETPVIMISALQDGMKKVIALDMGADDYMIMPFGALELASRIQSKIRKNIYEQIYHIGNIKLDDKRHICLINNKEIYFTNKEFSILRLLIKNSVSIVTKEAIFKDVWKTDFIGKTRTLDMHIKSLRQKLKLELATVKIVTVRSVGYLIE